MTNILIIYLVAINVVTFFVYGLDKLKAKQRQWRIPETVLLTLAVIGCLPFREQPPEWA